VEHDFKLLKMLVEWTKEAFNRVCFFKRRQNEEVKISQRFVKLRKKSTFKI